MKRRYLVLYLGLAVAALSIPEAGGQQPEKVYRLGWLTPNTVVGGPEEGFLRAMRENGYRVGENLVIEVRDAMGQSDRYAALAAELVALRPDCILTMGVGPTRAAKDATTTIPIVMGNADDDPVRQGLIASFARPGGNVTGVTNIGSDLAGKRLELLHHLIPGLSNAGILWLPDDIVSTAYVQNTETASAAIGVKIERLPVRRAEEVGDAFRRAAEARVQAVIVRLWA